MRGYFRRLENCRYRPLRHWLSGLGLDRSGHGWSGWLDAEVAIPHEVLGDKRLTWTLVESAIKAFEEGDPLKQLRGLKKGILDPNDRRQVPTGVEGLFCLPLTTRDHQRRGTRERVLEVAAAHPDRLKIVLNALVTKVLFDDDHRAIGVEYLSGARLYRAPARPNEACGEKRSIRASREVILAGGTFNTPQLLMLSGVGSPDVLGRHKIPVCVELPGVGKYLQDRYEIGVVNRMARGWKVLDDARFAPGDPQYREWSDDRRGMYTTNGGALVVIKRSLPGRPLPDLFCIALVADFRGYFPGYSRLIVNSHKYLSWAIL